MGRRSIQRSGEGDLVETGAASQLLLETALLQKRMNVAVLDVRARSIEQYFAACGDFIRCAGEEFALVLEGEVELHTDLYAPLRLMKGDSIYFDSDMGHAYVKAVDEICRILTIQRRVGH